jgi:ribosome biogenesis protein ERB1
VEKKRSASSDAKGAKKPQEKVPPKKVLTEDQKKRS